MGQPKWEADKMLDVYIHDYLVKKGLHMSAKTFMTEGKVCTEPVAIDAPGGFLFEWWSVFWDIFISRTNEKHSEKAASYIEIQQMKARELQIQQEQQQRQWQTQQQQQQQQLIAQLRRSMSHPSLNGAASPINPENLTGQSTANVMATKLYEDRLKQPHQREGFDEPALKRVGDSPAHFLDASNTILHKTASIAGQPSGPLFQNSAGNVSGPVQQAQVWSQPMPANSQNSLVMDSSMPGGSGARHLKCDLSNHGDNNTVPLKGWPLNSMDQLPPNLLQQRQKSLFAQQFRLLPAHQQRQILLQAQASTLSPILGEADHVKLKFLRANGLTGIDSLPIENDGSGRQMHMSSMARAPSQDQNDLMLKIKLAHMIQQQQPSLLSQQNLQQQQQQLQQQQQEPHQQDGKKRKYQASSGAANSSGTGNTPGPSVNSVPSTPSAHTPGDMMSMASTLQQSNSATKSLMMRGSDGTGGLASPSNQLPDIDRFEDCSLDENIESYLSHDDGEKGEGLSDTMKCVSEGHRMDSSKGLSFNEVTCLSASNSKVLCCHFSSDGKLLASAGHEKKAFLWNMDTFKLKGTLQEHTNIITDVRFSPISTRLALSSFDKTVRVWEADNPTFLLRTFTGHPTSVNSVDFHPRNGDLLCSCDEDSEIRYWNISQGNCKRISKGGTTQLRFQPGVGQYLAAAAGNAVSVFDVETDACMNSLQKHNKPVRSLCWNATGEIVASVSEDSVKIYSITDWSCIQDLKCTGNMFQSCVFHPKYPSLLVIGCHQTLELWNFPLNKTWTVSAHDSLITAVAQSSSTGMIASASYDTCVKLWK